MGIVGLQQSDRKEWMKGRGFNERVEGCTCWVGIILLMSGGFRNLIRTSLFTDDSFQPLLKHADEYRKVTQLSVDHFQSIVRNFEGFEGGVSKLIGDWDLENEVSNFEAPKYYIEYTQLYRNVFSEQRSFGERLANNFRELTALCNNLFSNFSNLVLTFQGLIRGYRGHESILMELSKKYQRTHKNMVESIQAYKMSFTDVKLIYNIDEKNKRYTFCEHNYKALTEQLGNLEEKVTQLSDEKTEIIEAYQDIAKEFTLTLKAIGSKLIALSKSLVYDFCQMQKISITYLAERRFTLEKLVFQTFLEDDPKPNLQDLQPLFNSTLLPANFILLPPILMEPQNLKDENLTQIGKMLINWVREAEQKSDRRKMMNRKVFDFTGNYIKVYERTYYSGLKEIVVNFDKVKKRLSDIFGGRLCSFLKSINSIFQLSVGINEKLLKRTASKLKSIDVCILEESKLIDLFLKELRNSLDRFLKKKEFKKLQKENEFTEEEASPEEMNALRLQVTSQAEFLKHLAEGFMDKMSKNLDQLKFQYNALVNDISVSTNEFYSLCCEYQELYFGEEEFLKNFKKYETDIDLTLKNESKFFEQINFGTLLKDDPARITFDSEINKVEEFKKLKRPTEAGMKQGDEQADPERKSSLDKTDKNTTPAKEASEEVPKEKEESSSKDVAIKESSGNKYEEFLLSKIALHEDEKFFKSFSCGLSDKIILTGRLYITNKRLCFHSKFNPSNVFFGDTFIQIPRKDIKKVEKRLNAIVFDNSISVTTVNGEVFFTSFFSRNEAFDLICSALDINADECMFEPSLIEESPIEELAAPQPDDISTDALSSRSQKINTILSVFDYKDVHSAEFTSPGLTALKYWRLFESDLETTINRRSYKSFGLYIKQCLEHKQIQIGEWSPQIDQYLNPANLKAETPQNFTRRLACLVPVANSGIPFMPKHAKSQERQTLFFLSADHFIIESVIQNSGVPYADSFNIRIRKQVQTTNPDTVKMTVRCFINFTANTMMRAIIQSKSAEETKAAYVRTEEEIRKYLKQLEKARNRSKGEAMQSQNEEIQAENPELVAAQEEASNLREQAKQRAIKASHERKLLLGSLVLNVLLILVLLS